MRSSARRSGLRLAALTQCPAKERHVMPRKDFSGDEDYALIGPQTDDLTYESHDASDELDWSPRFSRRSFLAGVGSAAVVAATAPFASPLWAEDAPVNLAIVAKPSSLYISGDTKLSALNDGLVPTNSRDSSRGAFGTWPRTDTQWVQYDWGKPVTTDKIDVYWWSDGRGVGLPSSYRVLYWNGTDFVPVPNARGLEVSADKFNTTAFDPVTTDKLRLEVVSDGKLSIGILEWKVYSSGPVPSFPPIVDAGVDRVVVTGGQTYLLGKSVWLVSEAGKKVRWTKESGPGAVTIADPAAPETTATFAVPGEYVLKLTGTGDKEQASATIVVKAEPAPPKERLDVVYTTRYAIDSPFWKARAKALIVYWIPLFFDDSAPT